MPENNPRGVCVCVCCVWELFSHLRDSPLVLSLHCCIHAHFLYLTILSVTHLSETITVPSITSHLSTTSSDLRVTYHIMLSLSGASVSCGCFSFNPFLICIYLYTEKYVCSDCQTIYWINNLSNQSQWHGSKASRPAWNSTDKSRRNSSDAPQVALHVRGSSSTFLYFLPQRPLPPSHAHPCYHIQQ